MRSNVAAAASTCIAAQGMHTPHRQPAELRQASFHAIEQVAVACQQAHQPYQVVAIPRPLHVGLARADAAVRGHRAIEAGTVYAQSQRRGRHRVCGRSEQCGAAGILDQQLSFAQCGQLRDQALAQEAIERSEGGGRGRCANEFVHGGSRMGSIEWFGCPCTGLPLSHSRRACQWMAPTTCAVISGYRHNTRASEARSSDRRCISKSASNSLTPARTTRMWTCRSSAGGVNRQS